MGSAALKADDDHAASLTQFQQQGLLVLIGVGLCIICEIFRRRKEMLVLIHEKEEALQQAIRDKEEAIRDKELALLGIDRDKEVALPVIDHDKEELMDEKRMLVASAQVSTARLDTREVETPDCVPGTRTALLWVAEQLTCSAEELVAQEEWDLSNNARFTDPELIARVCLLLGPAWKAVPAVKSVNLSGVNLSGNGASQLSATVLGNANIEVFNGIMIKKMRANSFTKLNLSGKDIGVAGNMVVASLLPVMTSLTSVR